MSASLVTPLLSGDHGSERGWEAPANPAYTTYNLWCQRHGRQLCDGSRQVEAMPQIRLRYDPLTNLNPGTTYTPTGQALVGNGDGTSTGWNSSAVKNGTAFTTAGFAGTFSIANITTTSADFVFTGLDLTGVTAYQMIVNGVAFGSQVNTPPSSPIHLTGLASNTQFQVQIKLIEASCNSAVPTNPASSGTQFDTLPAAPTAGSFGATTTTSIVVNWTDASTNGAGTTYHLQYSSNGGGTWTDFATNPAKVGGSAQSTTITGLTQFTTYNVRVKTVSISGVVANDSIYFQIPGTAQTEAIRN